MIGFPKIVSPRVETGRRHDCWVRIAVDRDGAHCELLGVGHRLPNVRRVSLDTAMALAARGVPTVVRSADGTSERLLPPGSGR